MVSQPHGGRGGGQQNRACMFGHETVLAPWLQPHASCELQGKRLNAENGIRVAPRIVPFLDFALRCRGDRAEPCRFFRGLTVHVL